MRMMIATIITSLLFTVVSHNDASAQGGCSGDLTNPLGPGYAVGDIIGNFMESRVEQDCYGSLEGFHKGVDHYFRAGRPLYDPSSINGTVVAAVSGQPSHSGGNFIMVKDQGRNRVWGIHHQEINTIPAQYVAGAAIGAGHPNIGNSWGYFQSSNPESVGHVHFELYCNATLNDQYLANPCLHGYPCDDPDGIDLFVDYDVCDETYAGEGVRYNPIPLEGTQQIVRFCPVDVGFNSAMTTAKPGILKAVLSDIAVEWDTVVFDEWGLSRDYCEIYNGQAPQCGAGALQLEYTAGPANHYQTLILALHDNGSGLASARRTVYFGVTGIDRYVSNFEAAPGSSHEVSLTWFADRFEQWAAFNLYRSIDGGVSYEVLPGTVPYNSSTNEHEYLDVVSTQHYQVKHYYRLWDSEGGTGQPGPDPWWDPPAWAVPSSLPSPPLPQGTPELEVLSVGEGTVKAKVTTGATWADEYVAYVGESSPPGGNAVPCVLGEGEVLCEIVGLSNGGTYYVDIAGVNTAGEGTHSTPLPFSPLTKPTGLEVVGGAATLYVAWEPVEGAAGYKVRCFPFATGVVEITDVGQQLNTAIIQYQGNPLAAEEWCVGVAAYDPFGNTGEFSSSTCAEVGGDNAVGVMPTVRAPQLAIVRNVPNPFNPATEIHFTMPVTGRAVLEVISASGRKIITLVRDVVSEGEHSVRWDGRSTSGARVGSGVYFARLRTTGGSATHKMVLVR